MEEKKVDKEITAIDWSTLFVEVNSSESGLTSGDASERLIKNGFNEIPEKKYNPIKDFVRRYWAPMPWLLETAMVLSVFLNHYIEAAMILLLLSVNAVIGYRHSRDSLKAISLLKNRLALSVRVLRDGLWVTVPAREAVIGDIISVKTGEIIPADARILSGNISVDQSSLTGESFPADLGPGEPMYSGSPIRQGEARALVIGTGENTYFGKTARLVVSAKHASHQEEVMLSIVKYMMYLGIAASILVAGYAFALRLSPVIILTFIVIFLMGAVPVALPAVLAIVQSVGALELSKKGAIVSRLEAIEDAASIDTLCLDKTGTITKNELSVTEMITFDGVSREDFLRFAVLSSGTESPDPIDAAITHEAARLAVADGAYIQTKFSPFDPLLKRTEAIAEADGRRIRILKGSPLTILGLCEKNCDENAKRVHDAVIAFSEKGYRSIGVALAEGDLTLLHFMGIIALSDPPRDESCAMIAEIKKLGIRPIMLTGDDIAIASQVAQAAGIGNNILQAADFFDLQDTHIASALADCDGVAGIYPEDKFKVVRALQNAGRFVGMTGDGINDAPALKQAEMGIAVDNAADVAKAAAGIVLTEPGLSVIVGAIETSRRIYQRMLSWVLNKIIKVMSFVGLLTVSFFWLKELPISLLGMSLIVFANDFATMSLATDNASHTPKPNSWEVGIITLASIIPGFFFMLQGLGAIAMGLYFFYLDIPALNSLVLLNLVFSSQFRVFLVRERGHFWVSMPGAALIRTTVAVIVLFSIMGIFGLLTAPLSIVQVAVILCYSMVISLAIDFPKVLSFKLFGLNTE